MTYTKSVLCVTYGGSQRILCRLMAFCLTAGAVGRQSALHKENSGFAMLHQSFFYSFITILPSESGVTLDYCTIIP